MTDTKENRILTGVIWKQLLLFFFPIMMGTLFQVLYNTVDAIVVGHYVGTVALAAVGGPAASIVYLVIGLFVGLTSGSSVLIAQHYGAGDEVKTSRAVHTSIALALTGGVIVGIGGFQLSGPLLVRMGTPAEVLPHAESYLKIFLGGVIFTLLYNMGSSILRARGDSKRPFYLLAAGALINIAADLVFVIACGWGVKGVACATVLSQALCSAGVVVCLLREKGPCRLIPSLVRFDPAILYNILAIGVPAALQSSMYNISNLIIQSTVNALGVTAVAAWTVYGKIDIFYWQVSASFGVALTTFAGQNFGARNYDRVKKSIWQCTLIHLTVSAAFGAVYATFARPLAGLFTADEAVISLCVATVTVIAPYYFTFTLLETLGGGIRSTGDSLVPTVIMAVGVCCLRLFWVWCVVPFSPSLLTVGRSYPLSWVVTSAAFLLYYRYGNWMERSKLRAGHCTE